MVRISDIRKTYELTLPSLPQVKIELFDGLLYGEQKMIQEIKDPEELSLTMLLKLIKSWNITEDDGSPLAINMDNLQRLPLADITFLLSEATKRIGIKKKTS